MSVSRMTLFKPIFIDQRIPLTPSEYAAAAPDMDKYLTAKIAKDLEGQCCTHGYVRPGSTKMISRSMGQAEHCRFTGDFLFHCKVRISCFLPTADQKVEARILKMNKLGAYALLVDEGRLRQAMRILLPRDLHLGNGEFDSLREKQGIFVRLLRSRFQTKDSFMQAVGMYEGLNPGADGKVEEEEEEGPAGLLEPDVPATEVIAPGASGSTVSKKTDAPLSAITEGDEDAAVTESKSA